MVYTTDTPSKPRPQSIWETRKQKAIERFISIWERFDDSNPEEQEEVVKAIDALTLAHMAAAFGLDGPTERWKDEDRAIERFVAAWKRRGGTEESPEAEEAVNLALDELTVANAAGAFEGLNGPIEWGADAYKYKKKVRRSATPSGLFQSPPGEKSSS
jgi:hypothetical protein